MTDRDALLAAIRGSPDDDLPRLVCADWFEEHGEAERAAFIRFQIEAARAEPFSPAARAAEEQAAALLTDSNRHEWMGDVRGWVLDAGFQRGFVHHVDVDAAQFPDAAAEIFRAESVRSLRLLRPPPSRSEYEVLLGPSLDVPQLERLHSLDLREVELTQGDCMDLAETAALANLERLSLRGNPLQPGWIEEMFEGGYWSDLRHLDLADIPNLGPALARSLPQASDEHRFQSLDLSGVAFRSGEIKRLLAADCLAQAEELHLRWNGGDMWPGALTHLELSFVLPWEQLRVLDLEGQGVGPEGVREIVKGNHAANLRWLGLARNHLGADGVSLLISDPDLELHFLDVRHNDLTPRDHETLRRRFPDAKIVT